VELITALLYAPVPGRTVRLCSLFAVLFGSALIESFAIDLEHTVAQCVNASRIVVGYVFSLSPAASLARFHE
jgi:hypothetical protein